GAGASRDAAVPGLAQPAPVSRSVASAPAASQVRRPEWSAVCGIVPSFWVSAVSGARRSAARAVGGPVGGRVVSSGRVDSRGRWARGGGRGGGRRRGAGRRGRRAGGSGPGGGGPPAALRQRADCPSSCTDRQGGTGWSAHRVVGVIRETSAGIPRR